MVTKYECKPCNYTTDRFFNYNKHLESKKHNRRATTKIVISKKDRKLLKKDSELSNKDMLNSKKVANIACEMLSKNI